MKETRKTYRIIREPGAVHLLCEEPGPGSSNACRSIAPDHVSFGYGDMNLPTLLLAEAILIDLFNHEYTVTSNMTAFAEAFLRHEKRGEFTITDRQVLGWLAAGATGRPMARS